MQPAMPTILESIVSSYLGANLDEKALRQYCNYRGRCRTSQFVMAHTPTVAIVLHTSKTSEDDLGGNYLGLDIELRAPPFRSPQNEDDCFTVFCRGTLLPTY